MSAKQECPKSRTLQPVFQQSIVSIHPYRPLKKTAFGGVLMVLGFVWLLVISSCSATEHLKEGQYLLKSEPTFNRGKETRLDSIFRNPLDNIREFGLTTIDPALLYSSVKTHPNRRMIIPKTYLHLYNLGRTLQQYEYPPETVWEFFFPQSGLFDTIANFLVNTAGEAPVLVDTAQLNRDAENLRNVYFANGFWDAKIYPTVDTLGGLNSGKAKVTFVISEGKAALIDKVTLSVDSLTGQEYKRIYNKGESGEGYIRSGDLYNEENLNMERNRLVNIMRINGLYSFSPRQVSFVVDRSPKDVQQVPPNNLAIQEYFPIHVTVKITEDPKKFSIGKISMLIEPATFDETEDVMMEVITSEMMNDSLREAWGITRRMYGDSAKVRFITYPRVLEKLNLNFLEDEIALKEGEVYSLDTERETQRQLQSLGIFKYVLIKPAVDDENKVIDFMIHTELLPRYQLKVGAEGFFKNDRVLRNNLPGVGGEIGYSNKMVFKGAEKFNLSAKGSMSFLLGDTVRAFWDGSATASLRIPRIVVPVLGRQKFMKGNPSTNFSLTFNRQQSREYTRNAASLDWTYNWFDLKLGPSASSSLSPYIITFIQSRVSQNFVEYLSNISNATLRSLLAQDYRPRFSSVGRYKFTWSDYMSTRVRPTIFIQPLVEMGGNTPYLIDRFGKVDDTWHDFKLDNIFYGQFVKASLEIKNYLPLTPKSELVIRNFLGVADPWNYTRLLPFDARFYSGGTNSMRGWQSNTLGPGTYLYTADEQQQTDLAFLLSPGGEAIFETNLELRADVYDWIEMALFTDIGNVWFLPGSKVDDPSTQLNRESYLHLGIDAGLGLRLDFSFFIFRVDVARKIYSPGIQDFVTKARRDELGSNLFQLNFGIGYPF